VNPDNEQHVQKLRSAVKHSYGKLRPLRKHAERIIRAYVGDKYGEGQTQPVPVNFIELTLNVFLQNLAPKPPRALVTTTNDSLKPTASALELVLEKVTKDIDLAEAERRTVINALIAIGVMKVGMDMNGELYAEPVDIDDWVIDINARHFSDAAFMGHRLRIPYEEALELYGDEVGRLKDHALTYDDLVESDDRLSKISRGSDFKVEDYPDAYIELWEIYRPRENVILTLSPLNHSKLLAVNEWDGIEPGPYHILDFAIVPGQAMPLPPSMSWYELHDMMNMIMRKLADDVETQKTVYLTRPGAVSDTERMRDALHGDILVVDDPSAMEAKRIGALDQGSFLLMLQIKNLYSYMTGGLEVLGGLGPSADTYGQERIISTSANRRIQDMQSRMLRFRESVMRSLAFYEFSAPSGREIIKRVAGIDVNLKWTEEERRGAFEDYVIDIAPYSATNLTPSQRLNMLLQMLTQVLIPMGHKVDQGKLVSLIARYADMPELSELLVNDTQLQPESPEPMPIQGQAPQAAGPMLFGGQQSPRVYVQARAPSAANSIENRLIGKLIDGMDVGNNGRT